jgi:hypothetical protein
MIYLKLFEQFNDIDSKIDSYLKESTFDGLPINFKKGFLTWQYEGEAVDFSIDEPIEDWVNDPNVDILIDEYSKAKGSQLLKYGLVPRELVIEKLTPIVIESYGSFEEYLLSFSEKAFDGVNHGDSLFPSIIGDEEEWIYDGWHRIGYYLNKGIPNIPIIGFI